MNETLKQYYEYLKGAGADVPPSFESFQNTLSNPESAKKYYGYVKSSGYDAPDTFDSFAKTLGITPAAAEPTQQSSSGTAFAGLGNMQTSMQVGMGDMIKPEESEYKWDPEKVQTGDMPKPAIVRPEIKESSNPTVKKYDALVDSKFSEFEKKQKEIDDFLASLDPSDESGFLRLQAKKNELKKYELELDQVVKQRKFADDENYINFYDVADGGKVSVPKDDPVSSLNKFMSESPVFQEREEFSGKSYEDLSEDQKRVVNFEYASRYIQKSEVENYMRENGLTKEGGLKGATKTTIQSAINGVSSFAEGAIVGLNGGIVYTPVDAVNALVLKAQLGSITKKEYEEGLKSIKEESAKMSQVVGDSNTAALMGGAQGVSTGNYAINVSAGKNAVEGFDMSFEEASAFDGVPLKGGSEGLLDAAKALKKRVRLFDQTVYHGDGVKTDIAKFATTTLPQGAGYVAAIATTSALSGGAISGIFSAMSQAGSMYQDALNSNEIVTGDDLSKTVAAGLAIGATDALPIGNILRGVKFFETIAGSKSLARLVSGGSQEALQEAFQTVGENLTANQLYDSEREVFSGVVEASTAGFLLGGFLDMGVGKMKDASAKNKKEEIDAIKKIMGPKAELLGKIAEHAEENGTGFAVDMRTGEIIAAGEVDLQKIQEGGIEEHIPEEVLATEQRNEPSVLDDLEDGSPVNYQGISGDLVKKDDGFYVQADDGQMVLIEGGMNPDASLEDIGVKPLPGLSFTAIRTATAKREANRNIDAVEYKGEKYYVSLDSSVDPDGMGDRVFKYNKDGSLTEVHYARGANVSKKLAIINTALEKVGLPRRVDSKPSVQERETEGKKAQMDATDARVENPMMIHEFEFEGKKYTAEVDPVTGEIGVVKNAAGREVKLYNQARMDNLYTTALNTFINSPNVKGQVTEEGEKKVAPEKVKAAAKQVKEATEKKSKEPEKTPAEKHSAKFADDLKKLSTLTDKKAAAKKYESMYARVLKAEKDGVIKPEEADEQRAQIEEASKKARKGRKRDEVQDDTVVVKALKQLKQEVAEKGVDGVDVKPFQKIVNGALEVAIRLVNAGVNLKTAIAESVEYMVGRGLSRDISQSVANKMREKIKDPMTGVYKPRDRKELEFTLREVFGLTYRESIAASRVIDAMGNGYVNAGMVDSKEEFYEYYMAGWRIGQQETGPLKQSKVVSQALYAEVINGFYSPIEQKLYESKQPKFSAKKWMEIVGKKDEAIYTGVYDMLAAKNPDEQVHRDEILQWMKDNRIEIREVVKGKNNMDWRERNGVLRRDYEKVELEITKDDEGYYRVWDGERKIDEEIQDLQDAKEIADKYAENQYGVNVKEISDTKYSEYQLEGEKSDYKEVLVVLPQKKHTVQFTETDYKRLRDLKSIPQDAITIPEYREMVDLEKKKRDESFAAERRNQALFKSSHFDEPNILVHLRMNTRTDATGAKVLFLEEIQSDWAQKGRKEGFKGAEKDAELKRLQEDLSMAIFDFNQIEEELDRQYEEKKRDGESRSELRKRDSDFNKLAQQYIPAEQRMLEARRAFDLFQVENRSEVPTAPFVTDTNAWVKLALKVATKEAVKQGADKIAWTTGEQQFERWGSEKIDWVSKGRRTESETKRMNELGDKIVSMKETPSERAEYTRLAEKEGWTINIQEQFRGTAFEGMNVDEKALSEKGITINSKEDLKAAIDRTLSREKNETERQKLTDRIWDRMQKEDSGTSLPRKEGMRDFYGDADNKGIVGRVAEAVFGQKVGVSGVAKSKNRISDRAIKYLETVFGKETASEIIEKGEKNDFAALAKQANENGYDGDESDLYSSVMSAKDAAIYNMAAQSTKQPSVDVTPEMVDQVQRGLPLFQARVQDAAQYHPGKKLIDALTDPDVSSPIHEFAHNFFDDLLKHIALGNDKAWAIYEEFLNFAGSEDGRKFWNDKSGTYDFGNEFDAYNYVFQQELFAHGLEQRLKDGVSYSGKLNQFFDVIKQFLQEVYDGVMAGNLNIKLSPAMVKMYDRVLGLDAEVPDNQFSEPSIFSTLGMQPLGQKRVAGDLLFDTYYEQFMTETADGKSYVFFHVSGADPKSIQKGIDSTKYHSTRTAKSEKSMQYGVASYYTGANDGESMVMGETYTVVVPKNKVYPMNTDPNGYQQKAEKKIKKGEPARWSKIEKEMAAMAKRDGYVMAVAEWGYDRTTGTSDALPAMRADALVALKPEKGDVKYSSIDKEIYHPDREKVILEKRLDDFLSEVRFSRRGQSYPEGYQLAEKHRIAGTIPTKEEFEIIYNFVKPKKDKEEGARLREILYGGDVTLKQSRFAKRHPSFFNSDGSRSLKKGDVVRFSDVVNLENKLFGDIFKYALENFGADFKIHAYGGRPNEGLAMYNPESRQIRINVNSVSYGVLAGQEMVDRVIAHEILHDIMHSNITKSESDGFNKEARALIDYALKNAPKDPSDYATTRLEYISNGSAQEIIAYAFTEPGVAQFLDSIPYKADKKSNTVFGKLRDMLVSFFSKKETTLYDAVVNLADKYIGDFRKNSVVYKPDPRVGVLVDAYMKSIGMVNPGDVVIKSLDKDLSKRIADAYEKMKHDPEDPEVKSAYSALAKETMDQYRFIVKGNYKIEVFSGTGEPYKNSKEVILDMVNNNHLFIFATDNGFGLDGNSENNPLLEDSGEVDVNGRRLLVNDIFRAVHDIIGHGALGVSFGPVGEENAWMEHAKMYSRDAMKALTSETRGQNSWVNFSGNNTEAKSLIEKGNKMIASGNVSEGQKILKSGQEKFRFADQKTGILPDFAMNEMHPGVERGPLKQSRVKDEIDSIVSESKKNGTYLKAPNGKKTNLSPSQWAMVRTKNFKNWFGDWENDPKNASKVVDENGEPKVVYHGTSARFDTFDPLLVGSRTMYFSENDFKEDGFFFSNSQKAAKYYAESGGEKGFIMNMFLNIRDPYVVRETGEYDSEEFMYAIDSAKISGEDGVFFQNVDEIHGREDQYVAFEPNQIKSATDNDGSFDADNESTLKQARVKRPDSLYGLNQSEWGAIIREVAKNLKGIVGPSNAEISKAVDDAIATLNPPATDIDGLKNTLKKNLQDEELVAKSTFVDLRNRVNDMLAGARDKKAEMAEIRKIMEEWVKQNRAFINSSKVNLTAAVIRRINNANTETKVLEAINYINDLIADANYKREQQQRAEKVAKIFDLLNPEKYKTKENALVRGKKIDPETIDFVTKAFEMLTEDRFNSMTEMYRLMDERVNGRPDSFGNLIPLTPDEDAEARERISLLYFAGVDDADAFEVDQILDAAQAVIENGKQALAAIKAQNAAEYNAAKEKLMRDFAGKRGTKTDLSSPESTTKKPGMIKSLVTAEGYDFVSLLDTFSHSSKEKNQESFAAERYGKGYARAESAARADVFRLNSIISQKQKELLGKGMSKFRFYRLLERNSKKRIAVTYTNSLGMVQTVNLTMNQMAYAWGLWRNVESRPNIKFKMEIVNPATGVTEIKSITAGQDFYNQIDAIIPQEMKDYTIWMMDEYLPKLYPEVNEVYTKVYGVKLGRHKYYLPTKVVSEARHDTGSYDIFEAFSMAGVTSGNVRMRISHNQELAHLDINDAVIQYTLGVTKFVHYAELYKEMRRMFYDKDILRQLQSYNNKEKVSLLHSYISAISDQRSANNFYRIFDAMRRNVSFAALAAKLPLALYQIFNSLMYLTQLPTSYWHKFLFSFVSGQPFWTAERRGMMKRMANSNYFVQRRNYGSSWEIMEQIINGRGNKMSIWKSVLMSSTLYGDQAAILYGGLPVYEYHYKKAKSNGYSDDMAHKIAEDKWAQATDATQQSGLTARSGISDVTGTWTKWFTMFATQPRQINRLIFSNYQNMRDGRISKGEFAKMFVIAHVVMPSIIQLIANGFDWDDEDQARAAIIGNLNSFVILGSLIEAAANTVMGEKVYGTGSPVTDYIDSTMRYFQSFTKDVKEGDDEAVMSGIKLAINVTGLLVPFPSGQTANVIKAMEEDSPKKTARIMGWSSRIEKTDSEVKKAVQADKTKEILEIQARGEDPSEYYWDEEDQSMRKLENRDAIEAWKVIKKKDDKARQSDYYWDGVSWVKNQ